MERVYVLEAKTKNSTKYYVHGVFKSEDGAKKKAEEMEKDGYITFISNLALRD